MNRRSPVPLHIGVIGARGVGSLAGGIETYCSHFYNYLSHDQFRVTLFVSRPTGRRTFGRSDLNVVPCIRSPYFEKLSSSFSAVMAARAKDVHLLHYHSISAGLSLPLARLWGMRTVVRHVGPEYERAKWGWIAALVLRLCEICTARYADAVVCLNENIAYNFFQATGRKGNVYVVPNGVSRFEAHGETDVLERFCLTPRHFVVAVGRLVPEKEFDKLILAFRQADLPASLRLVIVGPIEGASAYVRRLKAMAQECDRIVLAGALFGADLGALYRNCRIFILPSTHEGMSFSLLEAAVAGAPIVASDIPANALVCQGFGRLFAVGSIDDLTAALSAEWACERSREETLLQIAMVAMRHDWWKIAASMEKIFYAVAGSRGPGFPNEAHPG